jgi:hypothetical protein
MKARTPEQLREFVRAARGDKANERPRGLPILWLVIKTLWGKDLASAESASPGIMGPTRKRDISRTRDISRDDLGNDP